MANAFHAAHAPRATERPEAPGQTRGAVRALSVVSCWCRAFGVFGNEMGDGVYFLGREVDGTGTPAKA
jgi:hypothetical protein